MGTYTDDLVAYDNIVDGYDFDDEWAEYGLSLVHISEPTRPY